MSLQIPYINTCMYNLEKWYRWFYLQNRNTDTDIKKKTMDIKAGRGGGINWDWHTYTTEYSTLNIHWSTDTDWKLKLQILWPTDAKSQVIGKDLSTGKDWGKENGATEDEMVGWHHWLNRHAFEQALGDGKGQGSLVCCNTWGYKELDTIEQLKNNFLLLFSDVNILTVL